MTPQLDIYQNVIRRAYDKSAGQPFEVFYLLLVDSLEIAADLMGTMAVAPSRKSAPVLTMPQAPALLSKAKESPFKGAVLISSAPPVAGADGASDTTDDDIDQWETKPGKGDGCNGLETFLKKTLPISIKIQLPGFDEPLELSRGVGGPGLKFVYVTYSIPGSQEMGPRYTVMTSMAADAIDPDVIIKDIMDQATAMYSREKRTLVPRATSSPGMPSQQDLDRILKQDRAAMNPNDPHDGLSGDDARLASENAREWAHNRSPRWQ